MVEYKPNDAYMRHNWVTWFGHKYVRLYDEWLAAHDLRIRAAAWAEGFDDCAKWWEIHHHGQVRDESNPYREADRG